MYPDCNMKVMVMCEVMKTCAELWILLIDTSILLMAAINYFTFGSPDSSDLKCLSAIFYMAYEVAEFGLGSDPRRSKFQFGVNRIHLAIIWRSFQTANTEHIEAFSADETSMVNSRSGETGGAADHLQIERRDCQENIAPRLVMHRPSTVKGQLSSS